MYIVSFVPLKCVSVKEREESHPLNLILLTEYKAVDSIKADSVKIQNLMYIECILLFSHS